MAEGLPNVIDKSIFVGMAGGVQSHMMAGLKFLGLIDDVGRPTKALKDLTTDNEAERKKVFGQIVTSRYAALFAIKVESASMKQLLDTLESEYRVTGDTREKAARFFISAAQYAGIPLSTHILKGGISAGRKKTQKRAVSGDGSTGADTSAKSPPPPPPPSGGEQRVVTLAGGGTLTLTASVGFMKLPRTDRDFVFSLVDQLDAYEEANPPDDDTQNES